MQHYVLGFIFSRNKEKILLVKKKRPEWQAGRWNGIGGKIKEEDTSPLAAMWRECSEEINRVHNWEHCITFVCSGGTVFVYRAFNYAGDIDTILYNQIEDEPLKVWRLDDLPENRDADLNWLVAVCLSTIKFPICAHQNILGE